MWLDRFGKNTMSDLFIDRVFEVHVVNVAGDRGMGGEMDFSAFLNFLLAWENRGTPAAIRYFFKVFDINERGCLTQVRNSFFCSQGMHNYGLMAATMSMMAVGRVLNAATSFVVKGVSCIAGLCRSTSCPNLPGSVPIYTLFLVTSAQIAPAGNFSD